MSNPEIYDKSDNFTITERSITVTRPASNANWTQGDSIDIEWTSEGSVNNVKIDLYKGGSFNQTIVDSTVNSGSYTWAEVDTSLADGTDYIIKISDAFDSAISNESDEFTMEGKSIAVTAPTGSSIWTKGYSAGITWTSTGAVNNVKIYLYKDSNFSESIVGNAANSGSYTWSTVPTYLEDGTDYTIKISDANDSEVFNESDAFTLEEKTITVTEPTSSTVWSQGDSAEITWTSTGSVSNVNIKLYHQQLSLIHI